MTKLGWGVRRGVRRAGVVAVLALVVTACGGGEDKEVTSEGSTSSTVVVESDASTGEEAPAEVQGLETAAPGGPEAQAPSAESGGAASPSGAAPSPPASSGLPAAGDYRYHTTGSSKVGPNPAQPIDQHDVTTLVHLGGGRARQTSADQTTVLEWAGSQVLLHTMDLTRPGFERHFEAKPPITYAPRPLQVGQSWSWRLKATSYPTTLEQVSRVDRVETVTVSGRAVNAIVVVTKITLSGDVSGTIDLTQWVDTATETPTRIHAKANITTFALTSETTSDLTGFTPR